jgi:hypothetical protein
VPETAVEAGGPEPWDERAVAEAALRELGFGSGQTETAPARM